MSLGSDSEILSEGRRGKGHGGKGCGGVRLGAGLLRRLGLELSELCGGPGLSEGELLRCCREAMVLGVRELRGAPRVMSLAQAAEACGEAKLQRRPRTRSEFRSVCARLGREVPDLMAMPLHELTADVCREALERVRTSDRQRRKMRTILHGVVAFAQRRGWCRRNPLQALEFPAPREREVAPLEWAELRRLLRTARLPMHRPCMPPLGLMLWAGVRPAEVCRLRWEDIDFEERVVVIRPMQAKTGGCRHVSLLPVLEAWLAECDAERSGRVCPPNWERRWRRLRDAALQRPWQQDVLRHTFASYHAKYWHDFARLQAEMGHRSASLLRLRYLSMRGVTARQAELFWRARAL